jgi:MFS family permease
MRISHPSAVSDAVLVTGSGRNRVARKLRVATVALLGMLFGGVMLPLITLTLVLVPVTKELGWSATQFSFAVTILLWSGAAAVPMLGHWIDRIGARPVILTGTCMTGLATLAVARVHTLWTFYVCLGLVGVFAASSVGYSKVIGSLFTRHRGKALALLSVESSLATAFAPQLIRVLQDSFGWRGVFVAFGGLILATVPLLYYFLEEPGAEAASRGISRTHRAAPLLQAQALDGPPVRQVLRAPVFWLLLAAFALSSVPVAAITIFLVPILMNLGYSPAEAAAFLSVLAVASALGMIAGGCLLDSIPTAMICAPFCVLSALVLVVLSHSTNHDLGALLGIALLLGFSFGARQPMATYFPTRFFGLRAFAAISGVQLGLMTALLGLAPPLVARSQQVTGSYDGAFLVMETALFLAAVIYLLLGPYRFTVTGQADSGAA